VYHTGAPAYTVIDGIVYLSGSLTLASSGGDGLRTDPVPTAAQPHHQQEILVYTLSDSVGGLDLSNLALADSNPPTNARAFTSLAAVSYPVTA
jgi:hypothetical protein